MFSLVFHPLILFHRTCCMYSSPKGTNHFCIFLVLYLFILVTTADIMRTSEDEEEEQRDEGRELVPNNRH